MRDDARDPTSVELGISGMDAEHREQLTRMEKLEAAIASGRSTVEIAGDLEGLVGYLEAHFMSEQIFMRESAYPAFQAHQREHDEAVSLLRELQGHLAAGDATALGDLLRSLRGWLLAHIHTADRDLAGFEVSRRRAG